MADNNHIKWTSKTMYVDLETGEEIRKKWIHQYIKIKTNKYYETNYNKTRGFITYTIECRRNPQQQINFDNT